MTCFRLSIVNPINNLRTIKYEIRNRKYRWIGHTARKQSRETAKPAKYSKIQMEAAEADGNHQHETTIRN